MTCLYVCMNACDHHLVVVVAAAAWVELNNPWPLGQSSPHTAHNHRMVVYHRFAEGFA